MSTKYGQQIEDALRAYLKAQRRMLDKWADGDENVKRDLWRDLHACEVAAESALLRQPEAVPSGDEAIAEIAVTSHGDGGAVVDTVQVVPIGGKWPRHPMTYSMSHLHGTKLYTRPAPAAVKLPERQELFSDSGTADVAFVRGWNACLDAITHANEGGK